MGHRAHDIDAAAEAEIALPQPSALRDRQAAPCRHTRLLPVRAAPTTASSITKIRSTYRDVSELPVSADAADELQSSTPPTRNAAIAISSNIHPAGFDELMPKTMATATVDRLLHHAHVIITDGQESYRLAQAIAGKGVKPLT